MKTTQFWVAGVVVLVLLAPAGLYADDAEERAVKAIQKLGGKVTRDEGTTDEPVVSVDLTRTKVTDAVLKELAALQKSLPKLRIKR